MNRIDTEHYTVMSIKGCQNGWYETINDAVKELLKIDTPKRWRFGIAIVETYKYKDDNGNWVRSETYTAFVEGFEPYDTYDRSKLAFFEYDEKLREVAR